MDREAVLTTLLKQYRGEVSVTNTVDAILALQTPKERAAEEAFKALNNLETILVAIHASIPDEDRKGRLRVTAAQEWVDIALAKGQ